MRAAILAVVITLWTAFAFGQCPAPGSSNWCSGTYQYDAAGNIINIGADAYVYDELARLKSGTADVQRTGHLNRQNYEYDLFGNRTNVYRDAGSVDCLGGCELATPLTVSGTTNHITNHNFQYDDAGNLTRIDSATYSYDAVNSLSHAVATDDRQFLYTADDERIATKNGLTWTWTVRGLDKKVLREFTSGEVSGLPTGNRQWTKDYVWRDGQLLASVFPGPSGNVVWHYHLDHLGTPRVVSNASGVRLGDHAYYAFGAELTLTPHELPEELLKFTGHERDILGNDPHTLDMMHARYEMATLGRFMSIDPGQIHPELLQSWNRYTYALNQPMNRTDPDGRDPLGAAVGYIIGYSAGFIVEVHQQGWGWERPVDYRKVILAARGGAATGLLTGACDCGAWLGAGGGQVIGAAITRLGTGDEQSMTAVLSDFVFGAAAGKVGDLLGARLVQFEKAGFKQFIADMKLTDPLLHLQSKEMLYATLRGITFKGQVLGGTIIAIPASLLQNWTNEQLAKWLSQTVRKCEDKNGNWTCH